MLFVRKSRPGSKCRSIVNDVQHRLSILQLDGAIEAGTSASMAGRVVTGDLDFQPDCILVAIGADFLHGLQISGGFALFPDFPARTAEVVRRCRSRWSVPAPRHSYARPSAVRHHAASVTIAVIRPRSSKRGVKSARVFKFGLVCGGLVEYQVHHPAPSVEA